MHLLELLPYLKSKNIFLARRPRDNYNYFHSLVKDKIENYSIYSEVDFVESDMPPQNRMSVVSDAIGFAHFIQKELSINFDPEIFSNFEAFDLLQNKIKESSSKAEHNLDLNIKEITDLSIKIDNNSKRFYRNLYQKKIIRKDLVSFNVPVKKNSLMWSIDYPTKEGLTLDVFSDVIVSGWVYPKNGVLIDNIHLYVKSIDVNEAEIIPISLNISRPDVAKHFSKNDNCSIDFYGFSCRIPSTWQGWNLVIRDDFETVHLSLFTVSYQQCPVKLGCFSVKANTGVA